MDLEKLGFWGYLLFILIYNVATLLLIPGSILTVKGGCLYGLVLGSTLVIIAALFGAIIAFLLGRYYCRDWVKNQFKKYPLLIKIDRIITDEGWKMILLLRLSPLFPFNLLNYFLGVTDISLKDYILGSLAIVPGTIMYVYIGALARDLATWDVNNYMVSEQSQAIMITIRLVGLIATVFLTVYTCYLANKKLDTTLSKSNLD